MLSKQTLQVVTSTFNELDLSSRHTTVYLKLLELGSCGASKIAKETKIPRSTVYELLADLETTGLSSSTEIKSKTSYTPTPPDKLQTLLEQKFVGVGEKLESLQKKSEELNNLFHANTAQFPQVKFFQGEDILKAILSKSLDIQEILTISQGEKELSGNTPDYLQEFFTQVKSKKISSRSLLEDNQVNQVYLNKFSAEKLEIVLFVPTTKLKTQRVVKHIYNGKIAYVSESKGIIIEDQTIANYEKALFESLWGN